MSGVIDDLPEADQPYDRFCIDVTYPNGHHHPSWAGTTVRLRGDGTLSLAERRRTWHLNNGAASAVVLRQTWTPSDWEEVP